MIYRIGLIISVIVEWISYVTYLLTHNWLLTAIIFASGLNGLLILYADSLNRQKL